MREYGSRLLLDCNKNGRTFLIVCYEMEEGVRCLAQILPNIAQLQLQLGCAGSIVNLSRLTNQNNTFWLKIRFLQKIKVGQLFEYSPKQL